MGRLSAKENSYCSLEEVAGSVEAATPQEKGTVGGSFLVGVFAIPISLMEDEKGRLGCCILPLMPCSWWLPDSVKSATVALNTALPLGQ